MIRFHVIAVLGESFGEVRDKIDQAGNPIWYCYVVLHIDAVVEFASHIVEVVVVHEMLNEVGNQLDVFLLGFRPIVSIQGRKVYF